MKLIHWSETKVPHTFSMKIEKSNAVYLFDVKALEHGLGRHTHFFVNYFYAYRRRKETIEVADGFDPVFPLSEKVRRVIPVDFKRAIKDLDSGVFPKGWVFAREDWIPYGSWKDLFWKQHKFIQFLVEYTGMKKEETR